MLERRIFKPVLEKLLTVEEYPIVSKRIMKSCKWTPQLYSMKSRGKRPLTTGTGKGRCKSKINEFQIIESIVNKYKPFTWDNIPIN